MNRDNGVECYSLRRPAPGHSRAVFWLAILLFTIPFCSAQETSSEESRDTRQCDAIRQGAIYATLRFVPR